MPNDQASKIIIIPTYNERNNVVKLINHILDLNLNVFILVVDDNSPDGTGLVVDQLAKKYVEVTVLHRPKKEGLGKAYIAGFKYCVEKGCDYVITMDADMSHDPKYLKDSLKTIESNDVAIGSRYIKGVSVVNWSIKRLLLSYYANRYIRFITNLPVKDCTSGFICFRSKTLKSLNLQGSFRSHGYSFLVEIKYLLYKKKFKMAEFPIIFIERREGETKLDAKVLLESFLNPLKLRLRL